jgi:hypothetical protein
MGEYDIIRFAEGKNVELPAGSLTASSITASSVQGYKVLSDVNAESNKFVGGTAETCAAGYATVSTGLTNVSASYAVPYAGGRGDADATSSFVTWMEDLTEGTVSFLATNHDNTRVAGALTISWMAYGS